MKKIFKSIFILSIAALFASCNVDNIGTLYELENGQSGVSFMKTLAGDTEVDAKTTSFTIPVARAVADGALTVNLATTLPAGVKVPSSVTFNAGEYQTDIVLDISNMEVGKSYKGTVSFADKSQYDENTSISSINVTLAKAYTWAKYGTGTYHYNGDDCFFGGDDPGLEIFKADGFDVYYITHWGADATFNFSIQDGYVIVEDGPTAYTHSSYGPVRVVDCSKYFSDWDPAVDGMGYYDASKKTFYFSVVYYVSAGYFGYGVESFEMD